MCDFLRNVRSTPFLKTAAYNGLIEFKLLAFLPSNHIKKYNHFKFLSYNVPLIKYCV